MRIAYLIARFGEIDTAVQKAKVWSAADMEMQAVMAAYLVVFIAGCYEDCVEYLVVERAGKHGDVEVQNFIRASVDATFRNPRFDTIKNLIAYYSDAYKKELENRVDERSRAAIASIMNNKNLVSHGKRTAVTLGDVETFHAGSIPIFEALEDILA